MDPVEEVDRVAAVDLIVVVDPVEVAVVVDLGWAAAG